MAGDGGDEDVALERDELDVGDGGDGAVRGTSRRSAISPNASPGPKVRAEDLDLAALDHVEAVAGLALA